MPQHIIYILSFLTFLFVLGILGTILRRIIRKIILLLSESQVIKQLSILIIFLGTLFFIREMDLLQSMNFYHVFYREFPSAFYDWLGLDYEDNRSIEIFISGFLILSLYLIIYITLSILFFVEDKLGRWRDGVINLCISIRSGIIRLGKKIVEYCNSVVSKIKEYYNKILSKISEWRSGNSGTDLD